jgi:hypothetical protein
MNLTVPLVAPWMVDGIYDILETFLSAPSHSLSHVTCGISILVSSCSSR